MLAVIDRSLLFPFALIALTQLAPAQCGHAWQPIQGFQPMAPGLRARALAQLPGNRLAVGGIFFIGNAPGNCVTVYDRGTATWNTMAGGCSGPVEALAVLPNGDLVVGGSFAVAGGNPARGIARWDGTAWHAFGTGLTTAANATGQALALLTLPNGDLVVGGNFAQVDGVPATNIARWNGAAWSAIGTPAGTAVSALALAENGDLLAGHVALQRWDGTTWTTLGVTNGSIRKIVELPTGDGGIFVSGLFWAVNGVQAEQVARWDGSAWHAVGSGFQQVLDVLPDGSLLIAGWNHVSRFDGTTSTQLGAVDGPPDRASRRADGAYDIGGQFNTAGGQASPLVATLVSTCPASAMQVGAGCASSAGTVVLAATSLPWVGSVYEARATGVPANSIALAVLGMSPSFASLFQLLPPYGQPSCFLLASPDEVSVLLPVAGVATASLAIPSSSTLVGLAVRQQVLPFEFSSTGALTAVTSSNALLVTIGVF